MKIEVTVDFPLVVVETKYADVFHGFHPVKVYKAPPSLSLEVKWPMEYRTLLANCRRKGWSLRREDAPFACSGCGREFWFENQIDKHHEECEEPYCFRDLAPEIAYRTDKYN